MTYQKSCSSDAARVTLACSNLHNLCIQIDRNFLLLKFYLLLREKLRNRCVRIGCSIGLNRLYKRSAKRKLNEKNCHKQDYCFAATV